MNEVVLAIAMLNVAVFVSGFFVGMFTAWWQQDRYYMRYWKNAYARLLASKHPVRTTAERKSIEEKLKRVKL
jgi:hypothetical protein